MLIYQKTGEGEADKLNILINSTEPAASAADQEADVILTKLAAVSPSTVEGIVASFGTIQNKLSVTADTAAATIGENTLSLSSVTFTLAQEGGTIPATTITGSISLPSTINGNIHVTAVTPVATSDTYLATTGQLYDLDTRTVKSITASSVTPGVLEIQSGTNISSTIQVLGTSNGIVNAVVEGDNNGEIKITKNDGSTPTAIKVHGLATAAYKADSYFVTANEAITGGTSCKITYDAKGLVTAGASLMADDIPELSAAKITSGTFTAARIPSLNASKITAGQFANERIASATTWNNKIGSLTAGSFIEITGSGDSRTIAVTGLGTAATYSSTAFATSAQGTKADTAIQSIAESTINGKIKFTSDGTTYTEVPVHGLGTAAFKDTDYFLAAGATAVNASSLGGHSPTYYAKTTDIPSAYLVSAMASSNTLTLTNQAGTVITFSPEIPDGAIVYAGGHDSVLQKVTSIPGESTVRTNEINTITNFGAVLGERNYLGYTTDDNWSTFTVDETHGSNGTAVVGGANVVSQTEDAFVFGYKNRTFSAHQSIVGGYKNKVYASESAVFGEKHTINGALYEADGTLKTTTRKLAVFGGENTLGVGCQWDLVAGQSITINQYGKWVFSVGAKNRMDNSNEAVNQLGWNNQTGTYITDSTQIGYDNTTGNGASNNKLFNIVQIGHSNYSNKSETYMLGYNLATQHTSQVIAGRFNADVSSKDVLVVGCGHAADVDHGISELRENCFTAGKDGDDNKYIKVGSTTLTEAQLQSLLALI